MKGLLRVGEVGIRVMDIHAARRHYGEFVGLIQTLEDETGRLYYKAWDEHDHHSLVIRQADSPGIDYFAFKVSGEDALIELEEKVRAFGLSIRHIAAGEYPKSGRRIEFVLPSGHTMQLYAEKECIGNTLGYVNPGVIPAEGVIRGMQVIRLDHCLLGGINLEKNIELFHGVFELGISEKLIDHETGAVLAVFFSCSTKPHDVAFVLQPEPGKLHHVSFLLESVVDVYRAADQMGRDRIPIDVGPTRHGVTRGATTYFFDPSGNRNEVFTGGYVYYPDVPTLVWDTSELGQATFAQDNTPRESFLNVLT
ncbi:catechol 2,3-dioxygenase [Burkholderia multivorans]|nr:catechol 2,3-dioxygenase [Burkholderia multivorans]